MYPLLSVFRWYVSIVDSRHTQFVDRTLTWCHRVIGADPQGVVKITKSMMIRPYADCSSRAPV